MKKYRCTICGYIYDEAVEKVKFEDLPEDWKCPLCGVPKSLFQEVVEEQEVKKDEVITKKEQEESEDLRELTNDEISLICSNLARGCEKQYLEEEEKLFRELAQYYEQKRESKEGTLEEVANQVTQDLNELKIAMDIADKYQDRGAKRIITWATKTSTIMKVILDNYQKNGLDYVKNTKIWVCDICGFVYVGEVPPEICPICKVPSLKILEVK
mgnify:CR=1 FL=1